MAAENPVELFDLYIAHVGINAASDEEAEALAKRIDALMGLPPRRSTKASVFAGTLFEVMKGCGRGTKGHIGFHVNDVDAAAKWFSEHGFALNEDSKAVGPDGKLALVYFADEIAGFAIHLTLDE